MKVDAGKYHPSPPAGHKSADLLGAQGKLAQHIADFAPRSAQQTMTAAVEDALAEFAALVVEAGTGTGKTYAYLVPALLAGKKVIISTGTKTLQDQLYHRDLPVVRQALDTAVRIALLKGRANYLCRHRLGLGELDERGAGALNADLRAIRLWAGSTEHGDIAEVTSVPEQSPVWPHVTSTADNCLGAECPSYSECFVMHARRRAQEADIVVINHHLLCADMALKEEGFADLLPSCHAVIVDEAHQLAEIATRFFGISLSSRQLLELARDVIAEQVRDAADMHELRVAAEQLEYRVHDLRLALGELPARTPWASIAERTPVAAALSGLKDALQTLAIPLQLAAVRGKGLASCQERCTKVTDRLAQVSDSAPLAGHVYWLETFTRAFVWHCTPLDIAAPLRERRQAHKSAWVFTSATLTVRGNFDHFTAHLGLQDAHCISLDSPFDFARNALLYVPAGLPSPNDPAYTEAMLQAAVPVVEASGGRTFMLFTSHRALHAAAVYMRDRLPYPLLVQGSQPRARLLERFRTLGNAILLGSASFWEGVDVRGPALSCVIIDRLPFAAPDDPVLQARFQALRAGGGDPFRDYQLPAAVIALKQGVGRLIRDVDDRGLLMLCDPRTFSKPYGKVFLDSLPPMRCTRKLIEAQAFLLNA